jgi:hypothetical protein
MATTKSTTTAVPANAVDRFFGNVGEGGEKLENGQPVTETVTETEDKEEEKKGLVHVSSGKEAASVGGLFQPPPPAGARWLRSTTKRYAPNLRQREMYLPSNLRDWRSDRDVGSPIWTCSAAPCCYVTPPRASA